MVSLALLTALLLTVPTTAARPHPAPVARAYYVAPAGNDQNPGTQSRPFRSLAKLNQLTFHPGDRVLLAANATFRGNLHLTADDAGTPANPVTIGSFGGDKTARATIEVDSGSAVLVENAGGIVVENMLVRGNGYAQNHGSGVCIVNTLPGDKTLDFVQVRNVEATGFGRDITRMEPALVGAQNPAGQGIFVGGHARDKSKSGFRNVLIENCLVYDTEFYGILVTGFWQDNPSRHANQNVTIRNCTVHHIHGDPAYKDNHSGSGIFVEDTDTGLVDHCIAYETGELCSNPPGGGPCGIWTATSNNITIQYCEAHHNRTSNNTDGDGFDLDGGCTNCVMQYNYSHDNEGYGYLICSYEGAPFTHKNNVVRYNVSVNDCRRLTTGGAIHFWTDGKGRSEIFDAYVYQNTIINDRRVAVAIASKGVNNVLIANNLFVSGAATVVLDSLPGSTVRYAGNVYWSPDGRFRLGKYTSLDNWQRATGQEMTAGKPTGLFVSPELQNLAHPGIINNTRLLPAALRGLQPRPDSPLIGAGIDLPALPGVIPAHTDFRGVALPATGRPTPGAILP